MYKLLIHIGLPKTATTTFQRHLFYGMHKKGILNFLGRNLPNNNIECYNPLKDIIRSVLFDDDNIFYEKKRGYHECVKRIIREDKLNVLSEEQLSLADKYDLRRVFERLKVVFFDCDIQILLFLRNQVDFMYSYYVEMYRWLFYSDKNRNTFNKYSKSVISSVEKDRALYSYYNLVGLLLEMFGENEVKVLLYEQLIDDKDRILMVLADILNVNCSVIGEMLSEKKENVKKISDGCYVSDDVVVGQIVSDFFVNNFNDLSTRLKANKLLKKVYWLLNSSMLFKFTAIKGEKHGRLNTDEEEDLRSAFRLENERLGVLLNIESDILSKYGYI